MHFGFLSLVLLFPSPGVIFFFLALLSGKQISKTPFSKRAKSIPVKTARAARISLIYCRIIPSITYNALLFLVQAVAPYS